MKLITSGVRIASTGSALPDRRVTNAELVGTLPTSDEWVRANLGITERRIASQPHESTAILAANAAEAALDQIDMPVSAIGGVIVATSTPAQKAPSTACLVQNLLGIDNGSMAFDVQAVCSGFLYGLTIAASTIALGAADNILVIGADVFSTITDWADRSCVFFGDGAGAVLVRADADQGGLFASVLHADGSEHEGFSVPVGRETFVMNPKSVYDTAVDVLPKAINEVLALAGRAIGDIKYVVPHQPSRRVLDETTARLGVGGGVVLKNMERLANTAAATVPILLDQTNRAGLLDQGDEIVLAAVGSGWTWGAAVYRWTQ